MLPRDVLTFATVVTNLIVTTTNGAPTTDLDLEDYEKFTDNESNAEKSIDNGNIHIYYFFISLSLLFYNRYRYIPTFFHDGIMKNMHNIKTFLIWKRDQKTLYNYVVALFHTLKNYISIKLCDLYSCRLIF